MLPVSTPLYGRLGRLSRLAWTAFVALAMAGSLNLLPGNAPPPYVEVGADVCLVAPPTPYDPGSGLGLHMPRPVPDDARCPVCGMYPARSREWAAQVIFENGDTQFFDSPLSLFIYLLDVPRYTRGRTAAQITARYVTDASTGAWLAADVAHYVHGSDAGGPMRAGNFPAFATADAAQQFARERGGRLLRATDINAAMLQKLDTRSHRHH